MDESIIEARVAGYDETYHLSHLDFAGGRFSVIRNMLPIGHNARLRVLARLDIAGIPVLACVTRKSASALAPGKQVYAQVKAVALLE